MFSINGDPLDWTVEEVVEFLCHSSDTPWSQSATKSPRPDPTVLEVSLRENMISGEVLLNDVDKDALRNDLGLKALGHRSSMLMAIRYLRQNSPKFQNPYLNNTFPSGDSQGLSATSRSPDKFYSPFGDTRYSTASPQQGTPRGSSFIATSASELPKCKRIGSEASSFSTRPLVIEERCAPEPQNSSEEAQDDRNESDESAPMERYSSLQVAGPVASASSRKPRSGEHIIVDREGRKRRRLELGHSNDPPVNSAFEKTSLSADRLWYMGPNAITPDELFYPLAADDEGESFVIANPRFPTAQSSFVNKRLKYFYRQQPIKLNGQNGNSQWALVPYKPSKERASRQRYFTLYTSRNGQVTASKEIIEKWPQLNEMQGVELEAPARPMEPFDIFSLIAQKYQYQESDDDDVLPCYGDSGSEGAYDEETWQEIDDEQDHPVQATSSRLTPADVDSIISNSIIEYERKWRQRQLPKEEYRARALWLRAKKQKCTNQKIQAFGIDVEHLENRLKKLQDEIRKSDYASRSELETQCQCMEQTVFSVQSQKWRVSVLEQETCPPKIASAPKPRPKPKRNNVGDDESLHSESSGFIDDTSSDESQVDLVDDAEEQTEPEQIRSQNAPSSDNEVIVPSQARRKRNSKARKTQKARKRSKETSLHAPKNGITSGYIDLTQDSIPEPDDNTIITQATNSSPSIDQNAPPLSPSSPAMEDLTIETPPLNPVEPRIQESQDISCNAGRRSSVSPILGIGGDEFVAVYVPTPSQNAIDLNNSNTVMSTPWDTIEERKDRRSLLAKLIHCLSAEERDTLVVSVPNYDVGELKWLVRNALKAIRSNLRSTKGIDGDFHVIMRIASFFISWVNCVHLELKGISGALVRKALEDLDGFPAFFNEVCLRLKNLAREAPEPEATQGSSAVLNSNAPHKKRKREVKENPDARRHQETAQRRAAHQDKQRKALEQTLMRIGVSNDDPTRQAVSFGDPVIYLDPHIGQRVKPHQLKGIQFMWRELIEAEKQQGCLLAHTMGLGKTMQVISLLNTIATAASSTDERVFRKIPVQFRRSQSLVLCPSALVENWYEEFLMWTPPRNDIGPIRKITSSTAPAERLEEAFDWDREGGILILSYNIFQQFITNKETKSRQKPLGQDEHRNLKRCLLSGPNIIVADEAHKMKNSASAVTVAAKKFRSASRIALTGSPLANSLVEYYTMVDWIAPGYLGDFVEFKARYVEPIQEGLYHESTIEEMRKSLVKLSVLNAILEPKINRADITVLEGSLPQKVEFVLTFPQTELQAAAYNSYIASLGQGNGDVSNTKLWSWLGILSLCCNHPACFRDKLLSRANDVTKAAREDLEVIPGDESVAQAGLPETLIPEQVKLFETVPDIKSLDLSYRTQLLDKIVKLSIQAGDKILIFSHSIPTLDYLEYVLQTARHKFCRLDGKTPAHSRQAATKQFNTGSVFQVYLISTRAGGLGLNIPGANRIVLFDFNWNPVWEQQAVGRVYRIGQTKQVYVYRFLAGGTFEEPMYNKSVFKTQLAFRVVDKKNPIRRASKLAKEYLFPVKPVQQKDISEYIGKDPLVLDHIIKNDQGSIRRIALTETFQKEDDDRLTEQDRKDVQQELNDERLKRSDPAAYEKRMQERQIKEQEKQMQQLKQIRPPIPLSGPATQQFRSPYQYTPPVIPPNAHNIGPPPLPPDTSVTPSLRPLNEIRLPALNPHPFSIRASAVSNGQDQAPTPTSSSPPNSSAENSNMHAHHGVPTQREGANDPRQQEQPEQPEGNVLGRVGEALQANGNGRPCAQQ